MTQRYMRLSSAALDSALRLLEQPAGPAFGPKDFGNIVETGRRTHKRSMNPGV